MGFSSEVLTLEVEGHVATLWLDRAEARNAMGRVLWRDLPLAAAAFAADGNIRVLVRIRPSKSPSLQLQLQPSLAAGDAGGGAAAVAAVGDAQVRVVRPAIGVAAAASDAPAVSLVSFDFDRVFAPAETQADVFDELAGAVAGVVDAGKNACVMAYGQTG